MFSQEEVLQNLIASVRSKIPIEKHYLYHLNTVSNYILHFNKVTSDKDKTFQLLQNYLLLLDGGISINGTDSLDLFRENISPLIIIYERQANFTTHISLWILITWYILIGFLVFFLTKSIFVLVLVTLLFCVYYTFLIAKKKVGKVHGYHF